MKKLRILLPPAVILLGVLVAAILIHTRKPPPTQRPQAPPPLVRVTPVTLQDYRFTVRSEGTVQPRTAIPLVAEVPGRVIAVSPSLEAGGFFDKAETLVTLEPVDYWTAVDRARAEVKQAELRLAQEKALAEVAREEWKTLGTGEPSSLALHEPQVSQAAAALEAARAGLQQAKKNLDRTRIRAPFAGRVRRKAVDVGQFVPKGAVVAEIYATDFAEVRLPLSVDDVAFADLPLESRNGKQSGPRVTLETTFGGTTYRWKGRIVRTEGEVDPRSRMFYAVARVEDPYSRHSRSHRPPLTSGLFVRAAIAGTLARDVAVVPRSALRPGDRVLVVDEENRLHLRPVEVIRNEGERAILRSGLKTGDRVCLTPLEAAVEGMKVRVAAEADSSASAAGGNTP